MLKIGKFLCLEMRVWSILKVFIGGVWLWCCKWFILKVWIKSSKGYWKNCMWVLVMRVNCIKVF